nr:DKNYY domain-containing protein [uncultured Campylobacter sp.]
MRNIMVKNKKIWIIAIVLALVIPELILAFLYYAVATQDKFENIDRSNFYRSPDGEIYAAIAHSGRYLLKGADKDSFRVLNLPHYYYYSNVAADKNNVYCSTKILKGLDPKSARLLGNGYLTDGKISYFCSPKGEKQPGFNDFTAVTKSIANLFIKSYEGSSYFYKNVRIDSVNLEPVFDMGFAKDGSTLYYMGEKLDADPKGLKFIKTLSGQKSDYFTDGRSVFLDGVKLDVIYTDEMREVATNLSHETHYLFEPKTGVVFANRHKFSEQAMPFMPIYNEGDSYIYWPIFVGKDGVYFWDKSKPGLEKISNFKPKGEICRFYSDLFADDESLYFLQNSEEWTRSRHGRQVSARLVGLYRLTGKSEFRKIGDVNGGEYGAVFADNNKSYFVGSYYDRFYMKEGVYEIADLRAVEILTRPPHFQGKELEAKDIYEMIKTGALVPASGEEVAISRIEVKKPTIILYITFGITFIVAIIFGVTKARSAKRDFI